ncbi:hypothetical protein WMF30_22225 [Sorangium sp. So ce134]
MPRSIAASLLHVIALPAALAACGSVEIAPVDTSGGTGGGPAVTGAGGGPAVTGAGGGPAVTGTGGGPAVTGTGGGPAATGTGGSGAGGEDASATGSTGSTSTGPAPTPPCPAAECAVRIAEGDPKCAVAASGKAFCWWGGGFLHERLPGPVERPGLGDVVAASGLTLHMCFLHADGRVSCQGSDIHGLLKPVELDGERREVPVMLPEVEGVVQLSSGFDHSCGVLGSGKVTCWGAPYSPILGVEADAQGEVPVTVTGLDDAVQVAAGFRRFCALRATGEVVCWGALTAGGDTATPVRVEGIEGAVEIAAGFSHECARLATGKVFCWGGGGSSRRLQPVEVPGLDDAIQVSAGYLNRLSCALRQGGRVACWRFPSDMTPREIDVPEAVHVSAGYEDVCAALASGEIACWSPFDGGEVRTFGL